ncbi:MAG: hypothetical protein C0404_10005 [Verrucomicrobia bacterium]|nr:hypothetical protein [Verrucomicrobiota bacterium]
MTDRRKTLLLGSASERRRNILAGLLPGFDVASPDVEEVLIEDDPAACAGRNAVSKHGWCRIRYPAHHIITADTVISFEGRCIGKPATLDQAAAFLRLFSGRKHDVLTGLALSAPEEAQPHLLVVRSGVIFKPLSDQDISAYFSRVNPLDKAGAYDIDQSTELILAGYEGSYTNIMGLPKETVTLWLKSEGLI